MVEIIRVAVVEDDGPTREGLHTLIDTAEGFHCVAAHGSAEEALRLMRVAPDVLLLDVGLPACHAEKALGFSDWFPGLQILMLTALADRRNIRQSICNGACGHLKNISSERLLESIRQDHQGGSPGRPDALRAEFQNGPIESLMSTVRNVLPVAIKSGF